MRHPSFIPETDPAAHPSLFPADEHQGWQNKSWFFSGITRKPPPLHQDFASCKCELFEL